VNPKLFDFFCLAEQTLNKYGFFPPKIPEQTLNKYGFFSPKIPEKLMYGKETIYSIKKPEELKGL